MYEYRESAPTRSFGKSCSERLGSPGARVAALRRERARGGPVRPLPREDALSMCARAGSRRAQHGIGRRARSHFPRPPPRKIGDSHFASSGLIRLAAGLLPSGLSSPRRQTTTPTEVLRRPRAAALDARQRIFEYTATLQAWHSKPR